MVKIILMPHSEMDAGPAIANSTKQDEMKWGSSELLEIRVR
ncbi:hypothetical protein [Aerococcus kribbianus]|uniref:Uncharacterized protein n=1 Tax=Aerococcus kribbianus TaxID=2999064 RepID=A0A9X3JFD8_9LACT|nr:MULTISPECIES: hypothetical protein [unclassified Aerococcus]MCZ0717513.1 hypothetical protein [Aerococcus sp. YH-aer221]MCZ0725801.1 hypothetical protein [Aerococcus sp. YH-aer222]